MSSKLAPREAASSDPKDDRQAADSDRASTSLDNGPADADAIDAWRVDALNRLLRYASWVFCAAFVVVLREEVINGKWSTAPPVALATIGLGLAARWTGLARQFRVAIFVSCVLCACTASLLDGAFWAPNAFVGMAVVASVLAVVAGPSQAWASVLAFLLVLLTAGIYFSWTGVHPPALRYDPAKPLNWLRVVSIFGAICAGAVATASFLTRKLEQGARHNAELYRALRTESENKIRALEERRIIGDQLREAQKLEALGRLAGGVAHDFNNLLTVIINNASLLKERGHDFNADEALQEIDSASRRAAELTRQLLTFGRQRSMHPIPLDLNHVLKASLPLIRRLLPSDILIEEQLGSELGWMTGVPVELDQLIMNLCVNGRDAMPAGGCLRVKTSRTKRFAPGSAAVGEFLCLEVTDTGAGLSAEARERMFEPFFTTKEIGKGSGLGLSVVYGVVEQHQGFIEFNSEPGRGTTFSIYFPACAAPGPSSATGSSAVRERRTPAARETILIAEDDPSVRRIIGRLLSSLGYEVLLCCNGLEALQAYEQHAAEVRLVITDMVMPEVGGRALYERLRGVAPNLPFLFCSGYTSGVLPADILAHPLRALLPKPFSSDQLLEEVRRLLRVGQRASEGGGR